jgi:superoxide dismutase
MITNSLIDFQKFKDMPLVEILFSITMRSSAASRRNAQTLDLFNAASFAWNNDFYLSTLKSDGKPKDNAGPSPHVMKTFDKNFPVSTEDGQTSLEKFNKEFSQIALNILNKMGAEQTTGGFLWLMYEHGSDSLRIGRTFGSACPLFPRFGAVGTSSSSASSGNAIKYVPVLALSLNEHAYLYKYMSEEQKGAPLQLNAEKYISDFWDSVDWSQVANRMDAKNGLK